MGRIGFGFGQTRSQHVQPRFPSYIASTGWEVSTPDAEFWAGKSVRLDRLGTNQAGDQVHWSVDLPLPLRVRQPYPNHDSHTSDLVAGHDYIYATDAADGTPNGSAAIAPKPVAAWAMADRALVQNILHWEVCAFHRDAKANSSGNGQQVACVRVRASDGINSTAWQTIGSTALSTLYDDPNPIEVFAGDLDISALADGKIELEAEICPWFGSAASVLRSADSSDVREFSNRIFRKGTVPAYAYVASSGDDSTGIANGDAATAAASPCLTVAGALMKLHDLLGASSGALDGARIRIVDAVACGTAIPTGSYKQDLAAMVIEAAPSVAASTAIVTMAANYAPDFDTHSAINEGALTIRGLTWKLSGNRTFKGASGVPLHVQFENCILDMNGSASDLRANAHLSLYGTNIVNFPGGVHLLGRAGAADHIRTLRGVNCADYHEQAIDAHTMMGCAIGNAKSLNIVDPDAGMLIYNNSFTNCAKCLISLNASTNDAIIDRLVIVQNLIEWTGSDAAFPAMAVLVKAGNSQGAVIQHNTIAAARQGGRANMLYCGFATTPAKTNQLHDLVSFKGNLISQLNTRGDVFSNDGSLTGTFAFDHGVGCAGNFSEHSTNAPASGHPTYGGIGTAYNSDTMAAIDPLFTDDQSSTYDDITDTITAGAGGGTYTLQAGSPAKALLPAPVLSYDLAGNARGGGAQDAGAYQS